MLPVIRQSSWCLCDEAYFRRCDLHAENFSRPANQLSSKQPVIYTWGHVYTVAAFWLLQGGDTLKFYVIRSSDFRVMKLLGWVMNHFRKTISPDAMSQLQDNVPWMIENPLIVNNCFPPISQNLSKIMQSMFLEDNIFINCSCLRILVWSGYFLAYFCKGLSNNHNQRVLG